jgi:kynureninase
MLALHDMLDLIERAGIDAIRQKSVQHTSFVIEWTDQHLAGLGVRVASPREERLRGGHVTLSHPAFREVTARLWQRDVIPDFRFPDGLRVGLSPLSTTFAEVEAGLEAIREELQALA